MSDLLTYLASLFIYDEERPLLFTQIHFWVLFLIIYLFFGLIVAHQRRQPDGSLDPVRRVLRNGYLFAFSLLFYYKTSEKFVLLLIFSTLLGWALGIGMDKPFSSAKRKLMCTIGVVVNLAVLCFFKYAYFFTDIFNATFGTEYSIAIKIYLPVGISFFTFQNISYIVDVYKRKIPHVSNILDFGFYTAFFPQLVAGPILRADQFVPQLYKPFFLSRRQFGIAVFWICNGLIKKLILSDYLAVNFVDRVFENPLLYTPFENFSALMVYSLQVYADFSGYTDIAIGVAMLMGFYLPVNFNSPYKAQNPTDFWRRWHMSLSRWLRDYLYIPLGGNRTAGVTSYAVLSVILLIAAFRLKNIWFTLVVCTVIAVVLLLRFLPAAKGHRKTLGTNVNNMDTMLLGGLWHGSSFNFITWGGLQLAHTLRRPGRRHPGPHHHPPPHRLPPPQPPRLLLPGPSCWLCSGLWPTAFRQISQFQSQTVHGLVCPHHLRLHLLHPSLLPLGLQPRPRRGQRNGLAHSIANGRPHRLSLEPQPHPRHPLQLFPRLPPLRRRHACPLAPDALQTPLPPLVRLHAPVAHVPPLHSPGRDPLPVRHRRPPTVHLFPVLILRQKEM